MENKTPPAGTVSSGALFGTWIASADKPHPDKPGKSRYEEVRCLVVYRKEILIRPWNCEHLCWDTEDEDDHFCDVNEVTHWMPLPDMPNDSGERTLPAKQTHE